MTRAAARGPAPEGDLAEGVRAPGRPRRHRGAAEHPDARPGGAQADRVRLRARAAPGVHGRLGEARPRPAAGGRGPRTAPRSRGWTSTEVPDLYLTQFPVANAAAIGSGRPMVVVNSRTVELLDEHEMRTVLGHEAAHILSDHVLYRTALMILLSASGLTRMPLLRRPAADGGADGAARVVPRRRAVRRPRGHAGQPRPAGDLPDADGAGRRDRLAQARPRRVHPPGLRLRGVGARLGQARAHADRARARRTPSRSSASRS